MPVRFLSDAELARLSSWPDEIADDDLVIYFTLTGDDQLHAAVTELERVLTDPASEGLARVGEDGDLIVSPLPAEQVPAEAAALADAVAARLPQIHLPALLIEVDRDTHFSEAFTHAGGAQPRNPDLIRNLYASVLAYACNLGYAPAAHPAHPNPADRRPLERPAPARRIDEVRAHHSEPAHRKAARPQPAELPRPRAAGIRPTRAHHLPMPLRRRRRTPQASPPAVELGREPGPAHV